MREDAEMLLVVNKATSDADGERVRTPRRPARRDRVVDESVKRAERDGVALLDLAPDAPAVRGNERLADCARAPTASSIER